VIYSNKEGEEGILSRNFGQNSRLSELEFRASIRGNFQLTLSLEKMERNPLGACSS